MCGIVGIIGRDEAAPRLLDGLKRLEYRGYDSAGIACLEGGAIVGAGSVITRDVAPQALALARGTQMELPEWAQRFRDKMKQQFKKG